MNKKTLLAVCAGIALILVAVFFYLRKPGSVINKNSPKHVSHEFDGTLKKLNGSTLYINGEFVFDDKKASDNNQLKDVIVQIGENTKIIKTAIILPTQDELAKTNGVFYPDQLPKKETVVNLTTLQNDALGLLQQGIGIFAKSDSEVQNGATFTATEINYRVLQQP